MVVSYQNNIEIFLLKTDFYNSIIIVRIFQILQMNEYEIYIHFYDIEIGKILITYEMNITLF